MTPVIQGRFSLGEESSAPMRRLLLPLASALLALTPLHAQEAPEQLVDAAPDPKPAAAAPAPPACLSAQEIREAVQERRVVPQVAALRAARAAVAGDAVRARLCQRDGSLVYAITVLKKDGQVSRVYVDGPTGKVLSSR
jgi:hypothetical protein